MDHNTLHILNSAAQTNDFFSGIVIFFARYFIAFLVIFVALFVVSRFIPKGSFRALREKGGVKRFFHTIAVSLSASAAILFLRYVLGKSTVDTSDNTATLQAKGILLFSHGLSTETIARIRLYRAFLLTVVISPVASYIVTFILKTVVHAPRPFESVSNVTPLFRFGGMDSFPSGHATLTMAIAVAVFCYYPRLGIYLFFGALLVGFSRVAAGIHFPIDVIAGFMIGLVVTLIVHAIVERSDRALKKRLV